jgi:aspartyl-tRNA(Asn)/glutamyl-tRNA(Gln) amidotransferase subunit B
MTLMATIASTRLIIGMEVHVELATRSKMFSRSANVAHPSNFDALPNTLIDPVSLGLPGALPMPNREAIELAMMVGLALNCSIAPVSRFDRKNYFYPDLPKGYQISQYAMPLCIDGALDIELADGPTRRVGIIRAHLEEDTGKLSHDLPGGAAYDGSLLDLNRAGTPLLEIVTQPDLTSADEAVAFAKELRNICTFLGVTEGIMQRGHMRFEPNINVQIDDADGKRHVTPIVEVKNLNSFKSLHAAIEYEARRQVEAWQSDSLVHATGMKRTRGWDANRQVTFEQRHKEEAHDYRYFPEPDIPHVQVSDEWRDDVRVRLPELPAARRRRFVDDLGMHERDARALVAERDLCAFFEASVDEIMRSPGALTRSGAAQGCAKMLLNAGAKRGNERDRPVSELGITPVQLAQLVLLREANLIGSSAADQLFGLMCDSADDAETAARAHGLLQVQDESQLDAWIEEAMAAQPQAANDFRSGKDAAMGRLVGEVMKASKGQADAGAAQVRLRERLRP